MERNTARWEVTVAGWRREEERLALLLLFFSWQQLGECIFENVQDYRMSRDTKNQEAQLTLSIDFCFFLIVWAVLWLRKYAFAGSKLTRWELIMWPRLTGSSAVERIETKLRLIRWVLTYEFIVTLTGWLHGVASPVFKRKHHPPIQWQGEKHECLTGSHSLISQQAAETLSNVRACEKKKERKSLQFLGW